MPAVGDEVLYHSETRWLHAEVMSVDIDSALVVLLHEEGTSHAMHGAHIHGWLTYDEAARYHTEHASA